MNRQWKRIGVPGFVFLVLIIGFFFQTVVFGKVPFPGDLLLAQYQPWRSTSYNGITAGAVPNKAQYFDTLRQLYPWKTFALSEIKQGRFPLWNPHNFSGSPLFANFQSAILYPFNFVYLILPQSIAWSVLVMLQPLLSLVAMYLLTRKFRVSKIGSLLASLSYAFCLYQTAFLEYNILGHFLYLVPLGMLVVEYILEKKKWSYPFLIIIVAFGGFAGHVQLFAGMVGYLFLYGFIRIAQETHISNRYLRRAVIFSLFLFLGVGVTGIQLVPGIELIIHAARSSHDTHFIFSNLLIRPSQIILYLIPDLFGNPATNNYHVSFSYPSKALYVGVVALFFAILGILSKVPHPAKRAILVPTALTAGIVFLNPLSVIYLFHPPFLSSSSPSNFIFLMSLGLCLLSGFGFDALRKNRRLEVMILISMWAVLGVWVGVMFQLQVAFSRNNVIYSCLVLFIFSFLYILHTRVIRKYIFLVFLLVLASFDLLYFFLKFNPFVPQSFVYPKTEIGKWVVDHSGINRTWGYSYAEIEPNFATQIGFYAPDGYDPLYPKEYGMLIQSAKSGRISDSFNDETRSDAALPGGFGASDLMANPYQLKMLSLLGVSYILDKTENGSTEETFPAEKFDKNTNLADFSVYNYKDAASRFFLTDKFSVYHSSGEFSKLFYSKTFNPKDEILLTNNPETIRAGSLHLRRSSLVAYNSDSITIATETDAPALLFLSDTFYPGWTATVDTRSTNILRANYAFRAVEVPIGKHLITFSYKPASFFYGLFLSVMSIMVTIVASGFVWFAGKKEHE